MIKFEKKLLSLFLAVMMVMSVLLAAPVAASAESASSSVTQDILLKNGNESGLTITYNSDFTSVSYGTPSGSIYAATVLTKAKSGDCGTSIGVKDAVVIQNKLTDKKITFSYVIPKTGNVVNGIARGSVNDVSGADCSDTNSISVILQPYESYVLNMEAFSSATNAANSVECWIKCSNTVQIRKANPDPTVNVTVAGAAYGTVTVTGLDAAPVTLSEGESKSYTVARNTVYSVKAEPIGEALFGGIIDKYDRYMEQEKEFTALYNNDISAFFNPNDGSPLFSVGRSYYSSFEKAMNAAETGANKTVVMLEDGSFPAGTYTVPAGVNFVIPCDDTNVPIYNDALINPDGVTSTYKTPYPYRTLTLEDGAKLIVNGSVNVAGMNYAARSNHAGSVSGGYGGIVMNGSAAIELNDGSELYAWGYITGSSDSRILAHSGSLVHEFFQIHDFRGGNGTSSAVGAKLSFPIQQYYIQNIENTVIFEYGARETVTASVFAAQMVACASVKFIDDDGLFSMHTEGSTVTKYYDAADDKLHLIVDGHKAELSDTADFAFNAVKLEVGTYAIDSSDFALPFNNLYIDVENSRLSLSKKIELTPDTVLTIGENAVMDVTDTGEMYVIDTDQWQNNYGIGNTSINPLIYSPTLGKGSPRSKATMQDARINVLGVLNVAGILNTTEGGAQIVSEGGTGTINFISAPQTKVINHIIGASQTPVYDPCDTVSAILTNADGTTVATTERFNTPATFKCFDGVWSESLVTKHSITLDGGIQVNFYINLDSAQAGDYTVRSTFDGAVTEPVAVSALAFDTEFGCYKYQTEVNAPDMTKPVKLEVIRPADDKVVSVDVYRVSDYSTGYLLTEPDTELVPGAFYLVGNIMGVDSWPDATNSNNKILPENRLTETVAGYKYELQAVELRVGDAFKVVRYNGPGNNLDWFKGTLGDNYEITAASGTGSYDIVCYSDSPTSVLATKQSGETNTSALKSLLRATAYYGYTSQRNFTPDNTDYPNSETYMTSAGAFPEITAADVDGRISAASIDPAVFADYGLEYYGSSLVTTANTQLKHYFKVTDAAAFAAHRGDFTFNGSAAVITDATPSGDFQCFTLGGIAAADLDTCYELSCNGAVLRYSGLDYVKKLITADSGKVTDTEKAVGYALYWYNLYADNYFFG